MRVDLQFDEGRGRGRSVLYNLLDDYLYLEVSIVVILAVVLYRIQCTEYLQTKLDG